MKAFRFVTGVMTALALALISVRAMAARAPLILDDDFVVTNEILGTCGDFQLVVNGAGTQRIWIYFDRDGVPIRAQLHGLYKGTITNSVTGAVLTDDPSAVHISVDLVTGTETRVGAFFTVTLPGKGVVMFEVGRLVFDASGPPPVFIAGQQRPPDESIALLCDALR
jgi:hypothetical protein